MDSSTSPAHNGIILDTNVLSLFARSDRHDLLQSVFASARSQIRFFITPTIYAEIVTGYERGVFYLAGPLRLVESGQIRVLDLSQADRLFISSLPARLAMGEAEAIALCHRLLCVFVTHDRKAINYCERVGIPAIRLGSLLDRLHKAGLLTRDEIDKMLE
jgi:predicted nucleic acid-binding protein